MNYSKKKKKNTEHIVYTVFFSEKNIKRILYIYNSKMNNKEPKKPKKKCDDPVCDHELTYDWIDIDPDKSQMIWYCIKCSITEHNIQ